MLGFKIVCINRGAMIAVLILAIMCIATINVVASANPVIDSTDTIEVFLDATDEMDQDSIDLAHDEGFTLVYYKISALETIKKEINKNATRVFQPSIDAVKNELDGDYKNLSDDERTALVIKDYEKHNGSIQKLKNVLVTPAMRERYRRAFEDLQYANSHGIRVADLPALMFNGTVYKNTLDINKILDDIDDDSQ